MLVGKLKINPNNRINKRTENTSKVIVTIDRDNAKTKKNSKNKKSISNKFKVTLLIAILQICQNNITCKKRKLETRKAKERHSSPNTLLRRRTTKDSRTRLNCNKSSIRRSRKGNINRKKLYRYSYQRRIRNI